MPRRRASRCFLAALFLGSLTLFLWLGQMSAQFGKLEPGHPAVAQLPDADRLVQQGVDRYQAGDYPGAIAVWKSALTAYQSSKNQSSTAIVLENLARVYQESGQSEQAITYWEQTAALHRRMNSPQLGRILTEQAQTYSRLGQPRKAITLLCDADAKGACTPGSALQLARAAKDPAVEAAALGSLGDAYRLIGAYTLAIEVLQPGLEIAKTLDNATYQAAALNSLGNAHISLAQRSYRRATSAKQQGDDPKAEELKQAGVRQDKTALTYLQQSLKTSRAQSNPVAQMQTLLSMIPLYSRTQDTATAAATLQEATRLLEQLPDSRERVYAAIDLSRLLQPVSAGESASRVRCLSPSTISTAEAILQQAVAVAQRLQDRRAESFALGELGHLYECQNQVALAIDLTQKARWAADQGLQAKDSLYLWEWQTGRILKQQGRIRDAIAAYERAIATLEGIRSDILTANRDLQFDFRDTIDPLYRELVELKLSQERPVQVAANKQIDQPKQDQPKQSDESQKNFRSILGAIDSLKLAELQNYFGNDCVVAVANPASVDRVADRKTAIVNTIILEDRTAVILSLPNGERKFSWATISKQQLIEQVNDFRRELERTRGDAYNPKPSQQVYDWLIAPFAQDLAQAQIKTLVFVQDGILRTVPMAALHDRTQFLIERYAVATTPSLVLTDPRALDRQGLRVLALGLTKAVTVDGETFRELPNVDREITEVKRQLPGSRQLLNEDFTRDRLQQEISQSAYPIIHIATHGKFGTDAEDTFVVMGNEQKLTFNELDQLIRRVARSTEPLELLTLTACETAVGDDRSALGLAGVAVQAGARSALASLWSVSDAATAKIATDFYAKLRDPAVNRAEALQAAQVALLRGETAFDNNQYTRPAYWSAFVMVGNWL